MAEELSYYFERYAQGTLTAEERLVFASLLRDPANEALVQEILDRDWALFENNTLELSAEIERIEQGVALAIADKPPVVHRVHFLRRWGWAAAVLLLLGAGAYFWNKSPVKQNMPASTVASQEILPGSRKAMLTLSNGQQIQLDPSAKQQFNDQLQVIRNTGGAVHYEPSTIAVLNTITTPRGGEYELILPDQSHVWLNAGSSITYPTAFTGNTRKVSITGEVYFEVSKDKTKPFIIDVHGKSSLQVLGTSFNVNSYEDEGNIVATLVEGSLRVSANEHSVILKPGQQSVMQVAQNKIEVRSNVHVEEVIAWKNGLFNFESVSFQQVMQQLSRWYDVDVEYLHGIPAIHLAGEMKRDLSLAQVLRGFARLGVQYKLEGRKLTITN